MVFDFFADIEGRKRAAAQEACEGYSARKGAAAKLDASDGFAVREGGESVEDMGARIIGTAPPARGTRFAVIDFPPGNKPFMHRTESVDYVICLEGEIEMDMDESTVRMKAGDIMIQRGTNHAWANRGSTKARLAFVLIDAKPLGLGHAIAGSENAR